MMTGLFGNDFFTDLARINRSLSVFDDVYRAAAVDLTWEDRGDAFVVEAELPGVSAKDLSVTLTGRTVTMKAKTEAKGHRAARTYERSFTLPVAVDGDGVTAEAVDGIVTITLPKAAEAKPRVIEVKAIGALPPPS
jgi:HSP20 family protein